MYDGIPAHINGTADSSARHLGSICGLNPGREFTVHAYSGTITVIFEANLLSKLVAWVGFVGARTEVAGWIVMPSHRGCVRLNHSVRTLTLSLPRGHHMNTLTKCFQLLIGCCKTSCLNSSFSVILTCNKVLRRSIFDQLNLFSNLFILKTVFGRKLHQQMCTCWQWKKVLFNQKYLCTYLLISLLCNPSYNSYLPVVDWDLAVHLSTHLLSYLATNNKYLPTTDITCLTFLAVHTSQLTNYLLCCLLFIKL